MLTVWIRARSEEHITDIDDAGFVGEAFATLVR